MHDEHRRLSSGGAHDEQSIHLSAFSPVRIESLDYGHLLRRRPGREAGRWDLWVLLGAP